MLCTPVACCLKNRIQMMESSMAQPLTAIYACVDCVKLQRPSARSAGFCWVMQVQSKSDVTTFIQFEAPPTGQTFSVTPHRFSLPPLGSQQVRLTFSPQHAGQHYFRMTYIVKVRHSPCTWPPARHSNSNPIFSMTQVHAFIRTS